MFLPPRGCRPAMDAAHRAPLFSSCCKRDALTDVVLSSSERLPLTPPLLSFPLLFPFGPEQQRISRLVVKHMINVGAGVVDADYRGPVGVVLFNFGPTDFVVKAGDHVA